MTSVGTYWRTVRHLKARQVVGRMVFRLGCTVPRERAALPRRVPTGAWVPCARRIPSMIAGDRFRFLNEEHDLGDIGWDDRNLAKLWRYNQHYFDDLNSLGADMRHAWHVVLVDRWIRENPPAAGSGWEPYPTSLRIVNWTKWLLGGADAREDWLASLALQARWLSRRLEWHLLGNHLFANAKALLFAGLFFSGPEAERWNRTAVRILRKQIHEQVLRDGGQFELSPMYHLLAFEDMLDLTNLVSCFAGADDGADALLPVLQETAERMWAWAGVMRHDDGTLPRFNDTADDVAPALPELLKLAGALCIAAPASPADPSFVHLRDSGYMRMQWHRATAFLDVAAIGVAYLPGHAHADTLSFELSLCGRRVVVNRGTSCYGNSLRRAYERGTAAHSTVEVDGCNSSEVWGGFRVGRRARPRNLRVLADGVCCGHDGYRFLPGSPIHSRRWQRMDDGLLVEDLVTGHLPGVARYHLAPGLRLRELAAGTWQVLDGAEVLLHVDIQAGAGRIASGEQGRAFGLREPAETLEVQLQGGRAVTRWYW